MNDRKKRITSNSVILFHSKGKCVVNTKEQNLLKDGRKQKTKKKASKQSEKNPNDSFIITNRSNKKKHTH